MDERIKQQYHKIYSELYLIILLLAAASAVLKAAFCSGDRFSVGLELAILAGSPIYRFIRCRMLGIITEPSDSESHTFWIRLVFASAVSAAIFGLIMYVRNGTVAPAQYLAFIIPFLLLFSLVTLIAKRIRNSWKKRLDDKYRE